MLVILWATGVNSGINIISGKIVTKVVKRKQRCFLTLKRLASEGSSSPQSFWVSSISEMSELFFSGL